MNRRLFFQAVTCGLLAAGVSITANDSNKVCELQIKTDGGKITINVSNKTFTIGTYEAVPIKKTFESGTLTVEVKIRTNDSELSNLSKHLLSAGYSSVRFSK